MVCFKNVITGVLALCICVSVQAEYVYTALDVPGATNYTIAFGIDGGNIVGTYNDGSTHGFSYDGTTYTTLDVPGAGGTFAYGIDGGNIVGYYIGDYNDGSGGFHGFSYDGTTYTTLDVLGASYLPNHSRTWAYGIDGSNIVGTYNDGGGSGSTHGFSYDGTTYTTLDVDVPGASVTKARGIDGGNIVGNYYDGSGTHGFLAVIPEPTTLSLLAVGVLMACRRRRVTLSLPSRR